MPEYRRVLMRGGMDSFTVITNQRRPILTTLQVRKLLREAIIIPRVRRAGERLKIFDCHLNFDRPS